MTALAQNVIKLSKDYEALKKKYRQQQAEIDALKAILEQEGIGVGRDLLNGGIALFRKAQEK